MWRYNPLTQYEIPLFVRGHPWPWLRELEESAVTQYVQRAAVLGPSQLNSAVEEFRHAFENAVATGEPAPVMIPTPELPKPEVTPLIAVQGPVSASVTGIYEGWPGKIFPARSPQARWNSFNVGEFIFPESRWSLLPIVIVAGALIVLASLRAASDGAAPVK